MGYRERLVRIPKKITEKYREIASFEELIKKTNNSDDLFLGFKEGQELLTSYTEIPKDENVEDFFKNFSLEEKNEVRYQILTKKGLKSLIEKYEDEIIEMMDNKLKAYAECPELAVSDFHMKRQHWRMDDFLRYKAYKLDEDRDPNKNEDGNLVSIEYMEYQIFNVVHIYNTFDWENNDLIVSGW